MDNAVVWDGAAALFEVRRLNEVVLRKLREWARVTLADGESRPPMVESLLYLWRELTDRAIERAARVPVLLVTAGFEDEWRWAAPVGEPIQGESDFLSIEDARELLQDVLKAAARVGRGDVFTVRALFGTSLAFAKRVRGLSLWELEGLAAQHAGVLRPRWEAKVDFWRDLLVAALGEGEQQLVRTHLHAIQLLCGSLR